MGHIQATREIPADPKAVWAQVANPLTWRDWFSIHDSWVTKPPEMLATGEHLTARVVMLGVPNQIDWVVELVEVPTKLVLSGTGMAGVAATFTFTVEKADIHSRITVCADFDGPGITQFFTETVEHAGINQFDKSLEALNALASAAA